MISKKVYFLTMTLAFLSLCADKITVINHSDDPVWAGVYRLKENLLGKSTGDAKLQGSIEKIPANEHIQLDRSAFKIKTNREVIFSDVATDLKNVINQDEYKLVKKIPVGVKYGSTFHIAEKDNVLHGYNTVEWKVIQPIISAVHKAFDRMLDDIRANVSKHPYGKVTSHVRIDAGLAPQEINFLNKRLPKTTRVLENLLETSLNENETPRIAVCMSGGGMRAATAAEGLLEGLDSIGLLDALTYAAGLSGSTWTLASFVELGLPTDKYSKHFIKALSQPHIFGPEDLAHVLWPKYVFNQHTSIVDLYGVFLAQTFFHNMDSKFKRQDIHLSDSQKCLVNGDSFFPIYTAVEVRKNEMHWATFTPYEFGIDDFNMNIPIWALGRKFVNGTSTNFSPELSLGFLMGVWGSALSGSVRNILEAQKSKLPKSLLKTLKDITAETSTAGVRPAAVRIFNPLCGIDENPLRNLEYLTLMDAGYSFNLPFPPLLKKERAIDIIIVMDASANVHKNAPEFKKAVEYAEDREIAFPPIEFDSITEKQLSVFTDEDDYATPTIIFLAPVKNENYDADFDPKEEMGITYATHKFICNSNDTKKLSGLIRQNIIDNKDIILNAIRDKIKQKRKRLLDSNY